MNAIQIFSRFGTTAATGGGGPPPFAPDDIAGLALWLDADDSSTITESGGLVSQWDDKSGNGRHVSQATASSKPTTGTRTVNSLNVLDFDGSDYLSRSSVTAFMGAECTILAVAESDVSEGIAGIIDNHDGDTGGSVSDRTTLYLDTRAATKRIANRATNGSDTYLDLASELSAATPYLFTVTVTAADAAECFVDSASHDTATWGDITEPDTLEVGRQLLGPLYLNGAIAEIIVYDHDLSTSDLADVETYLADKWGITI